MHANTLARNASSLSRSPGQMLFAQLIRRLTRMPFLSTMIRVFSRVATLPSSTSRMTSHQPTSSCAAGRAACPHQHHRRCRYQYQGPNHIPLVGFVGVMFEGTGYMFSMTAHHAGHCVLSSSCHPQALRQYIGPSWSSCRTHRRVNLVLDVPSSVPPARVTHSSTSLM